MIARAVVLAAVIASAGVARADDRCADLRPMLVARMPQHLHDKIASTLTYQPNGKPHDWSKLVVIVEIARAPHLAPAILTACPGVAQVFNVTSTSTRGFTSVVRVRVTSFAVLTRLAQLPAVAIIQVIDPNQRIKEFEFEDDPIF